MPHGFWTRDTRTAQIPSLGAVRAGGPSAHCSTDLPPLTWQLPIGPRSRFWEDHLLKPTLLVVAPSYIYEERGSISTHPSSALASLLLH